MLMFLRRKSKPDIESRYGRTGYEIRRHAARLISLANRVETRGARQETPETTDATDVRAARALIEAQRDLLKHLDELCATGVSRDEIAQTLIEPIVDTMVVGDLAHLVLGQALGAARSHSRPRIAPRKIAI